MWTTTTSPGSSRCAFPFAVLYPAAVLGLPRPHRGSLTAPALKALGLLLVAALMFLAILHSQSRTGLVASLLSLFTIASFAVAAERRLEKRRFAMVSLLVLLLVAFVLLPGTLTRRFAAPVFTADVSWRGQLWRDTLGLIKAFPAFGCGLGAYESCFAKYQSVTPMFTFDFAHNDYLQLMAELGVIGFATGFLFLLRLFRQTVRTAITAPPRDRRCVAMACAGSFTAILVHSLADFNLYIPANAMLLAWISGIAATSLRDQSQRNPAPGR